MKLVAKGLPRDLTAPVEPITLDEAKEHLRLDADGSSSDGSRVDDALILAMLKAAREHAERFTGLTIARREREIAFDAFPNDAADTMVLNAAPVVELIDVRHFSGGVLVQDSSSDGVDFILDDFASPAEVAIAEGASWPTADARPNAVRVIVDAGFAGQDSSSEETAQTLPFDLRAGILLLLGHLYENREAATEKALTELPLAVDAMLRPHRVRLGMA